MNFSEIENTLADFFRREKIEYYATLDSCDFAIANERKLPQSTSCAVFFLVPYCVPEEKKNVSSYAVARDYHLFARELEERLKDALCAFPEIADGVRVFADNSPFYEVECALRARLGVRGKNRLLINEKYGTRVFIFSVTSPVPLKIASENLTDKTSCASCGKCISACPTGALCGTGECMSALTQKKTLTDDEEALVASHTLVWGCDICQDVCPMNKDEATPIEFFLEERIPYLMQETLSCMSDEEFSQRAYSWRGRRVIERNLALCDKTIITEKK